MVTSLTYPTNNLVPLEYQNQRILTTQQLADGYETDTANISNNFTRNKDRYTEGKHYYCLEGAELKAFKTSHQIDESSIRVNKLYLWTEKGALLHAKSLNTDKAWEVYDHLVETYFRARDMMTTPKTMSEALFMAAELQKQLEEKQQLIAFAETATRSDDSILIRELAKICSKKGILTGEKRLYEMLRKWRLIMPFSTEPYQEYVDRGYFEVEENAVETPKGVKLVTTTRVKPRGQQYIMDRLKKEA